MNLGFDLVEGPESQRAEDAPTSASMREAARDGIRRKPSTDEKKIKSRIRRQGSEEQGLHVEAQLLAAMAAPGRTLAELQALSAELDDIRAERRTARLTAADLDLADAVIHDHLTPVLTHVHHTAATDWIAKVADSDDDEYVSRCPACGEPIDYCQGHGESGDPAGHAILEKHDDGDHSDCDPEGCDEAGGHTGSLDNAIATEASLWFGRVSAAVKADLDEFAEQARGMARRAASAFPGRAAVAQRAFMDRVSFLHRQSEIEPLPDSGPGDEATDVDPWSTQDKTGAAEGASECPQCGSTNLKTRGDKGSYWRQCAECGYDLPEKRSKTAEVGPDKVKDWDIEDVTGRDPLIGDPSESLADDKSTGRDGSGSQDGYGVSSLPDEPDADMDPFLSEDWEDDGAHAVPSTRSPNVKGSKTAATKMFTDEAAAKAFKEANGGKMFWLPFPGMWQVEYDDTSKKGFKTAGNPYPVGTPNWFMHEQDPGAAGHGPFDSGAPGGGIPLHGPLSDEQQAWMDKGRKKKSGVERICRHGHTLTQGCNKCLGESDWHVKQSAAGKATCAHCGEPIENVGTASEDHWLHISSDPRAPIGSAQCTGDHWGEIATPKTGSKMAGDSEEHHSYDDDSHVQPTCANCGASIERDPAGEEPRTWHHNDGASHDHEAKPAGRAESKIAASKAARDLAVGDKIGPGVVSKVDTTTAPGTVYVYCNGKTEPPADATYSHGDPVTVSDSKASAKTGAASGEIGEVRTLTLPFSEVCMHMGVAGKAMQGKLVGPNSVQLLRDGGSEFSFPITAGEAGWDMVGSDHTKTDFRDGRWYPKSGTKIAAFSVSLAYDRKTWTPAGETMEAAEKAAIALSRNDPKSRNSPTGLVIIRDDDSGAKTVYEVSGSFGGSRGTYEQFYGKSAVKVKDLPVSSSGEFITCTNPDCDDFQSQYAASRGDYFMLGDDEEMTCGACGEPMSLARSRTSFDIIGSTTAKDEHEQAGQGESSLDDEPDEDTSPMWPWEIKSKDDADEAADVADVPTPGGNKGYPQPKKSVLGSWSANLDSDDFYTSGIDNVTRGMLRSVMQALNPVNREKFAAMPLEQAVTLGWKLVSPKAGSVEAAQSRNCSNGNHSDCTGSSCSCPCHSRSQKSGACDDGDHGACKMDGCPCSCHGKAAAFRSTVQARLGSLDWAKATPEAMCAEFKRLDSQFGTEARSPLHHDDRCPIHGQK